MLIEGKLERWNDERGFGFIVPLDGGEDIFVHVSAFPHDGRRPQNGELLAFAIEIDAGGRKRARDVRRPRPSERPAARSPGTVDRQREHRPSRLGGVLLALLVAFGVYGYRHSRPAARGDLAPAPLASTAAHSPLAENFSCDGRTRCRQMSSCAEARYFLQHCPGVEMDGDHDGIPCEDALCRP